MNAVARLIDFYRAQVEIIWNWRRGRRQLLLRAAISFVVAIVSLAITAWLLPGVRIDTPIAAALAVILIGALSALVRPILLALVAPFSMFLMLAISLIFQVALFMALEIIPGIHIADLLIDAIIAALTFAVINSIFSWLLSLDSDDSYYSLLVRRLQARRTDAIRTTKPGLVIIQIDGLSHQVLTQQINAGRVPVMSRWLREDKAKLSPWIALLPSQTSASQAGIMYGSNDDIPAFRWWSKEDNVLFVSNHAADAETLDQRLAAQGTGLLKTDGRDEGASIGNLTSGGAVRSYLTMATMRDPAKGLGHSRSYFSFFLSPYGFVHAIVLGIAEMAKEMFQARRARLAGIEPRLDRHFPYPFLRSLTNVILRPITTSLVIEEMLRGTATIYATYTDYDEIAHHSGPQRAEALDALDGVDRVLGSLERAAEDAPRPYRFVVLSDHGQTLGATFLQRFGHSLDDVLKQLMGGTESISTAIAEVEEWRVVNTFASELTRARGAATLARRALESQTKRRDRRAAKKSAATTKQDTDHDGPELVVCPSGNLALVYFTEIVGRADLETLNDRYPGMVDALANHPGIGIVMVRSSEHGAIAIGNDGVHHLANGKVVGTDPLEPYGEYAPESLKRIDSMSNAGDLVVISMLDTDTDQVAAFEELIGSHGGLGGPQTEPLILYPFDWELDNEPMVGAPAVHAQLMRWTGRPDSKSAARTTNRPAKRTTVAKVPVAAS